MTRLALALLLLLAAPTKCRCGCGLPAPIAKTTRTRAGYRKGDALRYRRGHAHRVTGWGIATGYRRPA